MLNFVSLIAKNGRDIKILNMRAEIEENVKVNLSKGKKMPKSLSILKLYNNLANEFLM